MLKQMYQEFFIYAKYDSMSGILMKLSLHCFLPCWYTVSIAMFMLV